MVAVTAQRLVELTCPFCENECTPFCYTEGRWKRASVFELLSGKNLHLAMKEAKGLKVELNYQTLRDVIRKGIALGYIKENEYERLIYDETN